MSKDKSGLDWDAIGTLVALVLSAIALLMAWQSNRIASMQFTPRLALLSADFQGGNWDSQLTPDNTRFVYCAYRIRFFNSGGAASSIVRYEVGIEFGDETLILESSESQALWSPGIEPYIASFNSELVSEDLPLAIEPFSAREITAKLSFGYDEDALDLNVSFPYNPTYDYRKVIGQEERPITLRYTFNTATGETLETDRLVCHYFKLKEGR